MIREDTHVTSGRRQVNLHDVCGGEDRLRARRSLRTAHQGETQVKTHLVREHERKFYLVADFGIASTAQGKRSWGTSGNGGDETERRHRWTGRVRW
jgi:hypothetical protein